MKPTCGPLPCPIAMSQPASIMAAMWWHVSCAATYWSRTDWCWRSRINELPPIAITAVLLTLTSPHRQGHHGLLRVQPVLGLVEDRGLMTVDHGVRDLDVAVGRKRVHVDGVVVGQLHAPLVRDPVFVLV